ncbi:MAG: carbohydrate ABC transporter permease, partial [Thermomicrobiales bacterium]
MSLGRVARTGLLTLLAAIWILPLYLVLINTVVSPAEYRRKEVYDLPQKFSLWSNVTAAWN